VKSPLLRERILYRCIIVCFWGHYWKITKWRYLFCI